MSQRIFLVAAESSGDALGAEALVADRFQSLCDRIEVEFHIAPVHAVVAAHEVERRYLTLVWGIPEARSGMVDAPIGRSTREPTRMVVSAQGKEARTRYEVDRTPRRTPAEQNHPAHTPSRRGAATAPAMGI